MLKSFIIHYTKLKERKEFMDYQLSKNPLIDYEYINEFDADDLTPDVIDKFYEKSPEIYKKKTENLWSRADSEYRELNLPEISCTLKHLEALKRASKTDGISLILEDDCCFSDDFYTKLEKKMSLLPNDWDAVFLGSGCGSWFQSQKIKEYKIVAENILKANHPSTNCAECYLVNKKSATKIINNAFPFHMISDWELAYLFYKLDMNIYWIYPSLAEQGSKNGMYKSTLDLGQR